jgi:hypothetical protein
MGSVLGIRRSSRSGRRQAQEFRRRTQGLRCGSWLAPQSARGADRKPEKLPPCPRDDGDDDQEQRAAQAFQKGCTVQSRSLRSAVNGGVQKMAVVRKDRDQPSADLGSLASANSMSRVSVWLMSSLLLRVLAMLGASGAPLPPVCTFAPATAIWPDGVPPLLVA